MPKQLRISVVFGPRQEEVALPNLVPGAEKIRNAALCSDSKPSASEDQCPDTCAAIVKMSTVGESETETMYQ